SKISEQIPLLQNHLDCGGYGRFTMIPGRGHISRARGEKAEALSRRVAWMLSQSYGTPFNYTVQTKGAVIYEVVSGERGFLGDDCHYGFFEPGSVVAISAPKTKSGRAFVKWASKNGKLADANSRRTTFTTAEGDTELVPIYGVAGKLTVTGGTANPAQPKPGDRVKITVDAADTKFLYWTTDRGLELPLPQSRSITICMPDGDLHVRAVPYRNVERRRR
ncbi:MAG: hypothetical protein AAF488_12730, partial [Planctomycetota bacterium]